MIHKSRLLVVGNVAESSERTTYLSSIKGISVKVNVNNSSENGLGLIDGEIENSFYTSPWVEKIWSTRVKEFGAQFGAIVVINVVLYGLNTAYN